MNKCVKNRGLLLFLIKSFLLRTCCLGRQSMSGSQLRQESWRREVMICMPKKPSSITLFLAMVQLSWFKIKTVSFHPSPEWQSWSSHNLSLLEVTQEGRIQASSGMAGKKTSDVYSSHMQLWKYQMFFRGFFTRSAGAMGMEIHVFIHQCCGCSGLIFMVLYISLRNSKAVSSDPQ